MNQQATRREVTGEQAQKPATKEKAQKTKPNLKAVSFDEEANELVLVFGMRKENPVSSTGKTRIIANSGMWCRPLGVEHDGHQLTINAQVYEDLD